MLSRFSLLLIHQLFHVWLPHEQDENDDSLQAIKKVGEIKDDGTVESPRNRLHRPRGAHQDKKSKIKIKSKTILLVKQDSV